MKSLNDQNNFFLDVNKINQFFSTDQIDNLRKDQISFRMTNIFFAFDYDFPFLFTIQANGICLSSHELAFEKIQHQSPKLILNMIQILS